MRILVDENIPGREAFAAYGEAQPFAGRALRRADLTEADALLVRSVTRINRNLLDGTPVRFVGTATIGVDHVDQEYLRAAGIGFASAPGCNARSVAEYIVAALLHLRVRHGLELEGKTLGIVGRGHVGSEVSRIVPWLGLKVLCCDPPLAESGHPGEWLDLPDLLTQSDIVTLHVPLVETGKHATRNLAGPAFFEALTGSKTFINTSRGEVVDETALIRARDKGLVSHLVLDVFAGEPGIHSELVKRADLATPHIAGYSLQGKLNGTKQVLEAFRRHFRLEKSAEPENPLPENPEITLPSGNGLEFNLHYCVTKSYDIARDDGNLRNSLKKSDPQDQFDALRRNYPKRCEFPSFRISNVPLQAKILRDRLTGLGFFLDS